MAETTTKSTRTRKTAPKTENEATVREEMNEKTAEKLYTDADVAKLIQDAIAAYAANLPKAEEKHDERADRYVTLMYLGAIARGTTVSLGKLGVFNKAGVPRNVPKDLFFENLGRPVVEHLLSVRRLIVLDGLTADERERYGLDYSPDEILTKNAFFGLLDYSKADVCNIFEKMCIEHKNLIAKLFYTAYFENHDQRVRADTVKELNAISKNDDPRGMFTLILEDMGRKFAE